MKKPNITEGEWYTDAKYNNGSPSVHIITSNNHKICEINRDNYMYINNAEAIKEVPNLIDALISAVFWMKHTQPDGYEVVALQMIKALEKAGCTNE